MISFHIIAIVANCISLALCIYFHKYIKKCCKKLIYFDGDLHTLAYTFNFIFLILQIFHLVRHVSQNKEYFIGPLILCISVFAITNLYIHDEWFNNNNILNNDLRDKYDYIFNPSEIGWENITMNELYKIVDLSQPLETRSSEKYTDIIYRRVKND